MLSVTDYIERYQMDTFLNDALLNALELVQFAPYSTIYAEDQIQHYLYFLVAGMVQCSHYHLNGELAIFAVSTPFCAIGELEILSSKIINSTVIATRQTSMLQLSRSSVHQFGADDPKFLRFLIDQTREKLYTANAYHVSQTLPVRTRLAMYIIANISPNQVLVAPDKDALASLLGTSLRHLNRVLRQFVADKLISESYPLIRVLDRAELDALLDI